MDNDISKKTLLTLIVIALVLATIVTMGNMRRTVILAKEPRQTGVGTVILSVEEERAPYTPSETVMDEGGVVQLNIQE